MWPSASYLASLSFTLHICATKRWISLLPDEVKVKWWDKYESNWHRAWYIVCLSRSLPCQFSPAALFYQVQFPRYAELAFISTWLAYMIPAMKGLSKMPWLFHIVHLSTQLGSCSQLRLSAGKKFSHGENFIISPPYPISTECSKYCIWLTCYDPSREMTSREYPG